MNELQDTLVRTSETRQRVRNLLREFRALEVRPADDDSSEPVDVFDLDIPDQWQDMILWGRYCGQIKRVGNGGGTLKTMWRWGKNAASGYMAPHRHPHTESFLVTRGAIRLKYRGAESTYRVGEGRRVEAFEPHEIVWCSPDTELFVMWYE